MRAALLVLVACSGSEAAPAITTSRAPAVDVAPIKSDALCVTKGEVADTSIDSASPAAPLRGQAKPGLAIAVPTMRGYALGAGGDAAQLTFTYKGESQESRALANGDVRRQIGLKLRAQDSCNVVYVMWRLDPRPKLDVSVKVNPGQTAHEQCGADGYTKIRSRAKAYVPAFEFNTTHTLRAEIVGDDLYAWVDGKLAFQGRLPEAARSIRGPAGLRSDNVAFDLVELAVPTAATGGTRPACKREGASD